MTTPALADQPVSPVEAALLSREMKEVAAARALLLKTNPKRLFGPATQSAAITPLLLFAWLIVSTQITVQPRDHHLIMLGIIAIGGLFGLSLQVWRLERRLEAALTLLRHKQAP
jgi:hypothetical protein